MSRSILQYLSEQDDTDATDEPQPQAPPEKKSGFGNFISGMLKKAPEAAKDAMKQTDVGKVINNRNTMMARINAGKD